MSKVMDEEQQRVIMESTRDEWLKHSRSTERVDIDVIRPLFHKLYEICGLGEPNVLVFSSPLACSRAVKEISGNKNLGFRDNMFGGNINVGWVAYYNFCKDVGVKYSDEVMDRLALWTAISKNSGPFACYDTHVIVSDRPVLLQFNDQDRPHSTSGPAVEWADGAKIYMINGVHVSDLIVERPQDITVKMIEEEVNVEVRRIMIDRYGLGRYMEDSGAVLIHSFKRRNADPIELYRKDVEGDEPIVMIKMINSTPEPDGTYKIYFERVPPEMTDAQEAMAWGWGMTKEEYDPYIET